MPVLPVPQLDSGDRPPPPSQSLLHRYLCLAKAARCSSQQWCRRGASFRDQDGKAVQQQIARARSGCGLGRRGSSAGDLVQSPGTREPAGEHRGRPGVEIGLARERDIKRLEFSGRLQE